MSKIISEYRAGNVRVNRTEYAFAERDTNVRFYVLLCITELDLLRRPDLSRVGSSKTVFLYYHERRSYQKGRMVSIKDDRLRNLTPI